MKKASNIPSLQNTHKKADNIPVRFSDVFGIDEIKDEIQVYVEYLKNPEKFDDLGAKLPKGPFFSLTFSLFIIVICYLFIFFFFREKFYKEIIKKNK